MSDYERRMRELAAQPFLRPGGENFDCAYANAVWDARERVELWDLMAKYPGQNGKWTMRTVDCS